MFVARAVHLTAAGLWIAAALGGCWAATKLRRRATRVRLFTLVGLGFVVGAHNLVLALAAAHPLRPIHLVAVVLLNLAGVVALIVEVSLGWGLARDERVLLVLSHAHPDARGAPSPRLSRPLSSREAEVLRRLCRGQTAEQMASELYLSKSTVETHIRNLRQKVGASTREDAVGWAVRAGVYDSDTGSLDTLRLVEPCGRGRRVTPRPWRPHIWARARRA